MPFSISDFNAEINKSSIAYPSHFEGWILAGPGSYNPLSRIAPSVLRNSGLDSGGMRFRIESLNMPGRTLTTLDQNYHGPVRSMPYRYTQQPVTLTIILSRDMREREVFMRWQDFFVGNARNNIGNRSISAPFDGRYYQDGIGTIQINQYSYSPFEDQDYTLQNEIKLIEAYPMSVHDINMSWGDDGYARLQVDIKYRYSIENNKAFGTPSSVVNEIRAKSATAVYTDLAKIGGAAF